MFPPKDLFILTIDKINYYGPYQVLYNVSTLPSIARNYLNFSISSSGPNSFKYFRNLRVSPPPKLENHMGTNLHWFKHRSLTGCRRSLRSICPWANQPLNDVQIPRRCFAVVAGCLISCFYCLHCSSWFGLGPLISSRMLSILVRRKIGSILGCPNVCSESWNWLILEA